jgi:hypothetical protein
VEHFGGGGEGIEVSQSVPMGFDGFSLIENTWKTSRIMNE